MTDPRHRAAIEKTGLPWRVIDRASGIEMVLIPPGTYLRGGRPTTPRPTATRSRRTRSRSRGPSTSGRTEVTNGQYRKFVPAHDAARSRVSRSTETRSPPCASRGTTRRRFCDRFRLRLPTEAEWELACRAGTATPRPGDLNALAIYANTSGDCTHPVGETQPNPWGFYDMLGNVWEWCWDWYDARRVHAPGKQRATTNDPIAFATGPNRVLRGGSWHDQAKSQRSSARGSLAPEKRDGGVGFRVARNP